MGTPVNTPVWVGLDNNTSLGPTEYGGRAAAPAFLEFYQQILDGAPVRDFEVPPGVVPVRIDPGTGLLAQPEQANALTEYFLAGTEPTQLVTAEASGERPSEWAEDPW